ncbi:trypsin-like isoform X1 [Contarinia nasturtii]|uniref:trypsin-like isoform X1 n=1 Tax=Contarinia nasturtii TaxID=265458 RepID=UPI0012D49EE9|nr:trypsin-like isoform X1 [Contarinia nasturtii]
MNSFNVWFSLLFIALFNEFQGNGKVGFYVEAIRGNLAERIEDHNYMVGIYNEEVRIVNGSQTMGAGQCVGVIIDPYKVVTAAHCVSGTYLNITLKFGSLNHDEPLYIHDVIIKEEIFLHPEYSIYRYLQNDIAVILLKKKIPFGQKIGKINLVERGYIPKVGESVSILGYTQLNEETTPSYFPSNLRYVNSTIADFQTSRQKNSDFNSALFVDDKEQFCVSSNDGKPIINMGDSGGPVLTRDNKLLGIVSWGMNEPEYLYDIMTLIPAYMDFINDPVQFTRATYLRLGFIKEDNPL